MGLRNRYRQLPPNLFRPQRRDVLIGVADAAITGMEAMAAAVRRPRMPAETDRTIALTVAERRVVAHDQDVVALTLVGQGLPGWHPGSHIDVHLPSGLVRQYSLCGDPDTRDTYRIAVRRIPHGGGGSIEVHDLKVGAAVKTHGPRNAFPLTVPGYGSPARQFRFIAGGIGITPILPMLGLAQRRGIDWSMVYAGRSRDSLPFVDEVSAFGDRVAIRTDDVSGGSPAGAENDGDLVRGDASPAGELRRRLLREGRGDAYLAHGQTLTARLRHWRMLTARAMTRPRTARDVVACTVMASLPHRASGITSVGLNAVALVNPR